MDARASSVFEMASEQFPPSEASLAHATHAQIVEQKAALALSPKKGIKRFNFGTIKYRRMNMKKPRTGASGASQFLFGER